MNRITRVWCCAVRESCDVVVTGGSDNMVGLWDMVGGNSVSWLSGHTDWVSACDIVGDLVVSGSHDATVRLWSCANRAETAVLRAHTSEIVDVSICGDTLFVLSSGGWDGTALLWNRNTMQISQQFFHGPVLSKCSTTSNLTHLATCAYEAIVWDTETRHPLVQFREHDGQINGCCLTAEGSSLVTCSDDRTVRVYDTRSGKHRCLLGHSSWVLDCTITPDNKHILSSSKDGTIKIWSCETGTEITTIKFHQRPVRHCKVSNDGKFMVSCSPDKQQVCLWSTLAEKPSALLLGHTAWTWL